MRLCAIINSVNLSGTMDLDMLTGPIRHRSDSNNSLLKLLLSLALLLLSYPPVLPALTPDAGPGKTYVRIKPSGTFTWVDGRRASFIAAPVIALSDSQRMESRTISFGKSLKWHDGTICEHWKLKPNHLYCAFLEDPLLSDTQLNSREQGTSHQLLNQGYEVICEGVSIGSLTDIDGRTLIVPMLNSALNGLFERPIDRSVMLEMARVLKQHNFTSTTPHLLSQKNFRDAISSYASHMGGFNLKFDRSPITRNLLNDLVINPNLRKRMGLKPSD
jgi:hypothetical protein